MLKKEVLEKLKKDFKLDTDKLVEAITKTEEVDYELPKEVTVLSNADLTTRDENMKTAGKTEGETIGEKKGRELAAKAFRKKFNLEDAVGVDIDKVVEAVNTKLNKGDAALQEQVTELIKDKEKLVAEKTGLEKKMADVSFDGSLIGMFPAKRTPDLKDNERLALLKMDLQFETVDGKTIVKRNGAVIADPNTHAALPLNKVMEDYFTERKWIAVEGGAGGEGGRGGGDHGGGAGGTAGLKSMSKFTEKWKAENPGKNDMSPEFDTALQAHTKDMKDFDFNN